MRRNDFFTNPSLATAEQLEALPDTIHVQMNEHATYTVNPDLSLDVIEHYHYGAPELEIERLELMQEGEEEQEVRNKTKAKQYRRSLSFWN